MPCDVIVNLGAIADLGVVAGSQLVSTETDSEGNTSEFSDPAVVMGLVDLGVSIVESADPVFAASGVGNLVYTVTVTNNALVDATGVVLSNVLTLPAGVVMESQVPSEGSFSGTTWTLGTLAAGASETLTVSSAAAAGTDVMTNTATVTAVNETDTNSTNDMASESTSIARGVDLSVSVSESVDPVFAGSGVGNLVYTVAVSNAGPMAATGVALENSLTLPTGVTEESRVPSQGSFSGTVWTLGTLASGASATLTVQSAAATGTDAIADAATVTAVNETDTNSTNDTASESTSITREVSPGDVDATDRVCTLREALLNANANSETTGGDCPAGVGFDVILLPAGVYTLAIAGEDEEGAATGDLDVTDPAGLRILGAGPRTTIVDGSGLDRVFDLRPGAALELEGVTVRGGSISPHLTTLAGPGDKALGDGGGGLRSQGVLEVSEVLFEGNAAPGDGGSLLIESGSATIRRSLFAGNQAHTQTGAAGGAIAIGTSAGSVTIEQSTLSANTSDAAEGGALSFAGSAAAVLSYVTITDNSSGLSRTGTGTLTIDSSIVTGNGSLDCSEGIDSGDYSVFGANGDASGCPTGAFDAVPSGDSGTVIDPLADNGGPTDTHPVFHGSPAIGLVPALENGCGLTATLDQRGEARSPGDPCEAGAYDGDSVPVELMQFSIE